ncbi:hypothetical protein CCACVL1_05668 [Corchorus capsularis]|uniref:Chaperone DnaJ C-terminal domain-containing protein n=1 Tax=Corchorus capsularis TaxID=210143 RepID=A0A1R3JJD0_COCAP|nr:hypothetical protein CCACVL1_05668 [Corchorus capsularis]
MNGFGQLELNGLRGHCGAPTRTSSCNKDSSKHRSMDTFFSSVNPCPVPRTTSKRSPSPSPNPMPSFVNRNGSFRSVDSTPKGIFPETLSRSSSRWSSNPIMFSNSTGTIKPPPIERKLECTLEDLCYGQIVEEEEILSIKVKPGWKKGTKITFEGMGNERPGCYAADVTFVIAEKRHNMFRRQGDDLELAIEIPLVKALTGCTIPIPLLGGEMMNVKMDDVIHPGYEKIIAGQGMPNSKEGSRGNLKVLFLINFPTKLADEQRQEAVRILEGSC